MKTTLQNNVELPSIHVYTLDKLSNTGDGDKHIHSSIVYNREQLHATQKFIQENGDMNCVWYTQILYGNGNEWTAASYMHQSRRTSVTKHSKVGKSQKTIHNTS